MFVGEVPECFSGGRGVSWVLGLRFRREDGGVEVKRVEVKGVEVKRCLDLLLSLNIV